MNVGARLGAVQCVVFDIDDTLYLERDYVRSGFAAASAACEVSGLADACWRLFLDGARGDTFDRALEACGVSRSAELIERLVGAYRSHLPDVRLEPDASNCLPALEHLRLGCITDGPATSQWAKINALGLRRWLSPVIVTAELGTGLGKPHIASFQAVEQVTGLPGPAHVYVADNPRKDFVTPRALGWYTVRVRRRGSLWEHVRSDKDVDVELNTLDDLPVLFVPRSA